MSYIGSASFFGATSGGGSGGGAQLTTGGYAYPGESFATLRFARNGGLSVIAAASGTLNLTNWWLPTTTTVGDSYEVKCTITSGAFSTGGSGTWYTISTNRDFSVGVEGYASFTCQIRRLSDSTVVASATFDLDTTFEGGGP